jgi:hypothetical protein
MIDIRRGFLIKKSGDSVSHPEYGELKPNLQLLLDNATRWNSAYSSIIRALRLKDALRFYLLQENTVPEEDVLTDEDWAQLEAIHIGLKPFWETTQRLEGHGTQGSHGIIWEALPVLDMLLSHTERYINAHSQQPVQQQENRGNTRARRGETQPHNQYVNPLLICYQNAWEVLQTYNGITDRNHEIYAAAALLNPCLRRRYFEHSWTDDAELLIEPMIEKNRGIWEGQYRQNIPEIPSEVPRSSLSAFIYQIQASEPQAAEDDFTRYVDGRPTPLTDWKAENLYRWWMTCEYPGLRQWALDTLSIPAMSAAAFRFSETWVSVSMKLFH